MPGGATGSAHWRPAAPALLRRPVPEPLLSPAGCRGGPHIQHPGPPTPTPLRAPRQTGGGGCSPPGVCWGHSGPAGSLRSSASPGWGCRDSTGPGTAGHRPGCQGGRPGLPVPPCSPRDGTVCGGAGRAGLAVHHSALQPGPLSPPRPCSASLLPARAPCWDLGLLRRALF